MSRTAGAYNPQYQSSDEKISPIPVLLIDSDGTIFYGNMKKIIDEVIRFLQTSLGERNSVDEFCQKLSAYDLREETMEFLQAWLKKHEDLHIPWDLLGEELYQIQQPIAESFRLIKSDDGLTALDVFKMVKEKNGVVIILTFNNYAPLTIRRALVKNGLSIEQASEIKIIYPTPCVTACPEDGIYTCPLPQGDRIDKNTFIKEAQRICREEFRLTHCEYIFADDEHARTAKLKYSDIRVVMTDEYASGQHLEILKNYIKHDADHESKQCTQGLDNSSGSEELIYDIAGEGRTPELKSLNLSTRSPSKGNDSALDEAGSMRKMSLELFSLSESIFPVGTKKFGQRINFFSPEALPPVSSPETMSDSNSDENLNQKIQKHITPGSQTLLSPLKVSSSMDSIEKSTSPESPISGQSSLPLTSNFDRNRLSQISPQTSEENLGLPKSNSLSTFPLVTRYSPSKSPTVNPSEVQNTEKNCCCLIL